MAKASEEKKDQDTLRSVVETLKAHGVKQQEAKSPEPPRPEKDSFVERAKVRDLGQEQGKKPEGVHQQMGWADRLIAARAQSANQGMSRGGAANDSKPREAAPEQGNKAANDHSAKASQPTSWADRVIASRPQGYGHGKVDAPTPEKGKEQEAKKEAPKEKQQEAKPKEAKPAAKAQAKDQDRGQDHGNER